MMLEDEMTDLSPRVQIRPYEAFVGDVRAVMSKNVQYTRQALIESGDLASPDKMLSS